MKGVVVVDANGLAFVLTSFRFVPFVAFVIPLKVQETAKIDGCSWFGVLTRVIPAA